MVRLYNDGRLWARRLPIVHGLNRVATHPFNVGYDFNHGGVKYTQTFCRTRLQNYWLTEYKVDGFRLIYPKGFQPQDKVTGDNVTLGLNTDPSRNQNLEGIIYDRN